MELTTKQLQILKERLECDIECMYDSCENLEEVKDELRELLLINIEICKKLCINETTTMVYQCCKKDILNIEV